MNGDMGNTFVIGDIHGAYEALIQCLERSSFNYQEDLLICLGDISDGWPQTRECIEELLNVNHLIYILGNHDAWTLEWMHENTINEAWLLNGGQATIESFKEINSAHREFFESAHEYFLMDNKLFVHAGILQNVPLANQGKDIFLWDRSLFNEALAKNEAANESQLTEFEEIYIGHTPIHRFGYLHPVKACEVWFMDTGAGWDGVLSIMDINSKEYFTSDPVPELYPHYPGRLKL